MYVRVHESIHACIQYVCANESTTDNADPDALEKHGKTLVSANIFSRNRRILSSMTSWVVLVLVMCMDED